MLPPLFLAGDLVIPLLKSTLPCSSSVLLSCSLLLSQALTVLSSFLWSSSSLFLSLYCSSSPKVSLEILQRLYSALELSTTCSPHLSILTASAICLVRAVLKNLAGLRWNDGAPSPPWWSWWCLLMWESSSWFLNPLQCSFPRSYRDLAVSPTYIEGWSSGGLISSLLSPPAPGLHLRQMFS